MKPSLFQRMDTWVRRLLPLGSTVLLVLLSLTPTRIPGFSGVGPALAMMGVFYWSIYRPDLLSLLAAFGIGLLHDTVSGTPLGVTAAILVTVQGVTRSQRRFFLGNTFIVVWWGFGLVAMAAIAATWLLVSLAKGQLVDGRAVIFEYLITVSLYPVVSWLLARAQVAFLRQS